ncbi:MAG: hypothetical protein KC777_01255 [Cyanobacteria bacterium HKST-UBA02]|nr:hypothetical protein [Cyanobacteria bacterium HKST-UBA02]
MSDELKPVSTDLPETVEADSQARQLLVNRIVVLSVVSGIIVAPFVIVPALQAYLPLAGLLAVGFVALSIISPGGSEKEDRPVIKEDMVSRMPLKDAVKQIELCLAEPITASDMERFWSKIDESSEKRHAAMRYQIYYEYHYVSTTSSAPTRETSLNDIELKIDIEDVEDKKVKVDFTYSDPRFDKNRTFIDQCDNKDGNTIVQTTLQRLRKSITVQG